VNPTRTHIPIPGTTNVRDLGGYPAADGLEVAPRRLYRAEVLTHPGTGTRQAVWDRAHAAHYQALGLRTVADLRSEREAARTPSAWRDATGANVIALPIAEGGEGTDTDYVRQLAAGQLTRFDASDLGRFYQLTLDRRAGVFGAGIRLLADPGRLPLLVHCSAGKDRTGLLVALVLELLGTPRELVTEDYALTGVLRPNRVAAYADLLAPSGLAPDAVRALFETPAEAMTSALGYLDTRYGGIARYLVESAGLDHAELNRVGGNLLIRPRSGKDPG
jgi:protein-tyrosine phosphatase